MTRILISGNNLTTWTSDGPRLVCRKFLKVGKYHIDFLVRKEYATGKDASN